MIKKMVNRIKKFLKNDIVERCYKTFLQAFIGVVLTASATDFMKTDAVKTLLVAGIIAGVSAVWNTIKIFIDNKIKKLG